MKFRFLAVFILLVFAFLVSACAGGSRLAATSWPGVTNDGETVYLASGSYIHALQASNGNQKWKFPAEPDRNVTFFAAPTLGSDGQLFVGSYNNVLYNLNPKTGQLNGWTFEEARNRFIASPLATDEGIFAPSADGYLYALDFQGNLLWTFLSEEAQWAQPATDGEKLFLPSMDHRLYVIDIQTGKEIRRIDLGGAIVGKPAVGEDGVVYVGDFSGNLQAIDTNSGRILWKHKTNDWVWAGPALDGDTLYFGDISGTFYTVDTAGKEKWQFTADSGIFGTPLITEDAIYFGTEAGTLYAFTPENEQLWSREIGGNIYSSPSAMGDLILVATLGGDNLLTALDSSGSIKWSFAPETNGK